MKIKKIYLEADVMRTIRTGEKTQIRNVMDPQPELEELLPFCVFFGSEIEDNAPCRPGDILCLQENDPAYDGYGVCAYVKAVRAERLQEISPLDICAEGINAPQDDEWDCEMSEEVMNQFEFEKAWDKLAESKNLNQYRWENNPWVWVIEFERMNGKEAA